MADEVVVKEVPVTSVDITNLGEGTFTVHDSKNNAVVMQPHSKATIEVREDIADVLKAMAKHPGSTIRLGGVESPPNPYLSEEERRRIEQEIEAREAAKQAAPAPEPVNVRSQPSSTY
jgi:hypothetical protein